MNPRSDNTEVQTGSAADSAGRVAVLGAGPGDPELLTLRGAALLAEADVVFLPKEPGTELAQYRSALLRHCREEVQVVDTAGLGTAEADARAVGHAREGLRVVRLYGGDPLLNCRGAELAEACREAGVEFEISPGLSSVTAVPAHAGIPLLPEGVDTLRVVSAKSGSVDFTSPTAESETLAVMFPEEAGSGESQRGGPGFDVICKALIAGGRPKDTPVAVVRMGATTHQTTVVSTLARLTAELKAMDAKNHHLTRPALLLVGPGVREQPRLSWYETRPLFGWRVLVPRTKEQAAVLSDRLRAYGAVPEQVPTISVEPPRTPQQMERAVRDLYNGRYQWVAFTSTNAVRAIRERLEEYRLDARALGGVKVAAVGDQTAEALRDFGIQPDLIPEDEQQSSQTLVEAWPPYDAELDPIGRVLLPRADIATETLSSGLDKLGWEVDDVTAYRTVRAAPPPAPVREAIKGGDFDAVLFTSSSTVRNLVGIAGKPHATTVIGVIGPETAKTAEEFGLRVDVVAPKTSVSALTTALAEYGSQLRAEATEAGKPALRPSQKRRARRRKTV